MDTSTPDVEPSVFTPADARRSTLATKKLRGQIRSAKARIGKMQKAAFEAAEHGEPTAGLSVRVHQQFDALAVMEQQLIDMEEDRRIAQGDGPVSDSWLRRNNCSDGERACFGFGPAPATLSTMH